MIKNCFKCGKDGEKDKDIILFQVPIESEDAKWQVEFQDRLGIQGLLDKEVFVCSTHFLPKDLEMKDSVLQLKENALPLRNDQVFEEHLVVKPELIYEGDMIEVGTDPLSANVDSKDLVPLEPLVEYMNVYDVREEVELADVKCEIVEGEEQVGSRNIIISSEYVTEDNGTQQIAVVNPEGNNFGMEPVMPFFLTSSPMFTIVNDNSEVGETIILQIEDLEERKLPPPSKDALDDLQLSLCKSQSGSITSTYTCDICEAPYGCLNCLKSHYETFHILSSAIRRYKCKFSRHESKSLVCPVCDLTFDSRNETMDHYITHSVGCDLCGSGFDRQTYLMEHYKTVHNKGDYQAMYECQLCKMSYQHPSTLTKHYRTFHKMTLCYVCKTQFENINDLQEHEKVHQEKINILPFACSKCDMAFPKISDIAVHIRNDHKWVGNGTRSQKVKSEGQMPVQKKVKVKK